MLKWIKWIAERRYIITFILEIIECLEDEEISREELDRLLMKARNLLIALRVVI
ncbi:hypothetical protein GF312_02110 [Candidatus Poribacteria bacterium]|nr:hypothetical protein [Candidatus Poribacteria bacterium]